MATPRWPSAPPCPALTRASKTRLRETGSQQLGADDLARYGYRVSRSPRVVTAPWRNTRTGQVSQVPVGIDPGWAYHVGRAAAGARRAQDAATRLIAKLDAQPAATASAVIEQGLASPAFAAFLRQPTPGAQPVALLPESVATALGATSPTVRLSAWTAAKQAERHPDVTPPDYQRVQRVLDGETVLQSSDRPGVLVGFMEDDGRWWRAVIKRTTDGTETYLVSYSRVQARKVRHAERTLTRVGGG